MKIKLRGGVSLAEQISFYRQLAVILRSGLPLLNALQLLQKHGNTKQMLLCYRLQQRLRAAAVWLRPWQQKRSIAVSWQLRW